MSYRTNNLSLTNADVQLKAFVREKEDVVQLQDKRSYSHKLSFDGDEAKKYYDEIILDVSQRNSSSPRNSQTAKDGIHEQRQLQAQVVHSKNRVEGIDQPATSAKNVNTLFKAIEMGNFKFIRENFNANNVNVTDQFGWTPLMCAAYAGNYEIVDFFMKLGARTKVRDKAGFTALNLSLKKNNIQITNLLKDNPYKKKKKEASKTKLPTKCQEDSETNTQDGFYCNSCETFFKESSRERHETSTLHIFNGSPKLRNIFYGIPKQNKGYQMLLSNGWNEEVGLGPHGEGQKYPVKTVLKRDRKGLGQTKKDTPRVTHFDPRDKNAIESAYQLRRPPNKRDREKHLRKETAKIRAFRRALS